MLDQKSYLSVDIEHTWASKLAWGSIISLGSCVVWDIDNSFYQEMKPINEGFHEEAIQVWAKNLLCLEGQKNLSWEEIMAILNEKWEKPEVTLQKYSKWVQQLPTKHIEAAAPIKFDGWLMAEYYRLYNISNPLWYSGEDINSLLRGLISNTSLGIKSLYVRGNDIPHNALRDAQIQAIEMELILELMKINAETRWELTWIINSTDKINKGLKKLHTHNLTQELFSWAKKVIKIIAKTPIEEELPQEALGRLR